MSEFNESSETGQPDDVNEAGSDVDFGDGDGVNEFDDKYNPQDMEDKNFSYQEDTGNENQAAEREFTAADEAEQISGEESSEFAQADESPQEMENQEASKSQEQETETREKPDSDALEGSDSEGLGESQVNEFEAEFEEEDAEGEFDLPDEDEDSADGAVEAEETAKKPEEGTEQEPIAEEQEPKEAAEKEPDDTPEAGDTAEESSSAETTEASEKPDETEKASEEPVENQEADAESQPEPVEKPEKSEKTVDTEENKAETEAPEKPAEAEPEEAAESTKEAETAEASEENEMTDNPEKPDVEAAKPEETETTEESENPAETEKPEENEKPEETESTGESEKPEETESKEESENPAETEPTGEPEKPDETESTDTPKTTDKPEKSKPRQLEDLSNDEINEMLQTPEGRSELNRLNDDFRERWEADSWGMTQEEYQDYKEACARAEKEKESGNTETRQPTEIEGQAQELLNRLDELNDKFDEKYRKDDSHSGGIGAFIKEHGPFKERNYSTLSNENSIFVDQAKDLRGEIGKQMDSLMDEMRAANIAGEDQGEHYEQICQTYMELEKADHKLDYAIAKADMNNYDIAIESGREYHDESRSVSTGEINQMLEKGNNFFRDGVEGRDDIMEAYRTANKIEHDVLPVLDGKVREYRSLVNGAEKWQENYRKEHNCTHEEAMAHGDVTYSRWESTKNNMKACEEEAALRMTDAVELYTDLKEKLPVKDQDCKVKVTETKEGLVNIELSYTNGEQSKTSKGGEIHQADITTYRNVSERKQTFTVGRTDNYLYKESFDFKYRGLAYKREDAFAPGSVELKNTVEAGLVNADVSASRDHTRFIPSFNVSGTFNLAQIKDTVSAVKNGKEYKLASVRASVWEVAGSFKNEGIIATAKASSHVVGGEASVGVGKLNLLNLSKSLGGDLKRFSSLDLWDAAWKMSDKIKDKLDDRKVVASNEKVATSSSTGWAAPSNVERATPSNAERATPSNAERATPSNAEMAASSGAAETQTPLGRSFILKVGNNTPLVRVTSKNDGTSTETKVKTLGDVAQKLGKDVINVGRTGEIREISSESLKNIQYVRGDFKTLKGIREKGFGNWLAGQGKDLDKGETVLSHNPEDAAAEAAEAENPAERWDESGEVARTGLFSWFRRR